MSNPEHHAPAMTCEQFVDSIDNLVREWATDAEIQVAAGAIPRAQLETIYNEVRNSTAYELALAQSQRDQALARLHKHYTKGETK